jgi:molecular chaperone DnaK
LEQQRARARETSDLKAQQVLQRIDSERMQHDVETSLAASGADRDAADKCEKRLLDLQLAVDEIENALEWPALVAEGERELGFMRQILEAHGNASDRQAGDALAGEYRRALETRDADLLRRRIMEIAVHKITVWQRQPGYWVAFFQELEALRGRMRDPAQAAQYIQQGQRAINAGDRPALEAACLRLFELLPEPDRPKEHDPTRPR